MIKNFHRPLWDRVIRHRQKLLIIGALTTATLLSLVFAFYENPNGDGRTFLMTAAGYSLVSMSFAILVTAALSRNSWLHRIRIPGAYHIALWSYSIYLSHKAVMMILRRELEPYALPSVAMVITVAVISVLVGALLYRLVEAPIMALRDRWLPSNFAGAQHTSNVGLRVQLQSNNN